MASNGPIEPSANIREFSHTMREFFLGLIQEGFTEPQALVIIGQLLAANMQGRAADE